jgi:hypothetical protein
MLRYAAILLIFSAKLAGFGLQAHAREAARPTQGVMANESADGRHTPRFPNTREVPMELLDSEPRGGLILPSEPAAPDDVGTHRSESVFGEVPRERRLLPEGYMLGGRCARIERVGDNWVALLEPTDEIPEPPLLRLLANERLEILEAIVTGTDEPIVFLLSGRVSEFAGANYLLIEHVGQLPAGASCGPMGPVIPPLEPPSVETQATVPHEAEPQQPVEPPAAIREPTAEDVVRELMATEPVRAVVMPESLVRTDVSDEDAIDVQELEPPTGPRMGDPATGQWPEGTLLIDRVGRVVLGDDGWWMLAFEDRGHQARIRPVRLLPNRLLEEALSLSDGGTRGIVFEISGEVTVHRNMRYLLLRKVLIRRDIGNFR